MTKQKSSLDSKKTDILDKIADYVCKRGLSIPAILFLESMKPLHFIGSQSLMFFEPFLTMIVKDGASITLFREAMEDKIYVEYLLQKIEAIENR